jgi:3-phenylpropionate/trans-cinnamate dioxygenase ferredoxin component
MKNMLLSNNLNEFKKICSVDELKNKEGKRFLVDDVDIAVFKVNDEIFALSNKCPHQQTQLIYDGFIEDNCVVCPAHGWMFDLKTGSTQFGSKGLDVYEVKILNDEVHVKVKKKNWKF